MTVVRARSALVRRSSSQSGKNDPWRSFAIATSMLPTPGVELAATVAVAGIGAVFCSGAVISAADSVCLSGQDVVDDVTEHLAH